MKTQLLVLLLFVNSVTPSFSQSCGNSGPLQCTPTGTLAPGTFTRSEDIVCVNRGQVVSSTSHFTNFDTITIQGMLLTIQNLRIDSIGNLPPGLCWSTNEVNDSFNRAQPGCIHVSGVTYAQPGQYKLSMLVTVNVGFIVSQVNADAIGLKIFLRLTDPLFPFCHAVDTQTDSIPFIPYGYSTNVAEIKGKLFFDANQNQVLDIGEQPVSNQLVSMGNGDMALTNPTGNYTSYSLPSTLTIQPSLSANLSGFAYNPGSIVVVADSGISYPNNNFGILTPPNFCEGTLALVVANPPPRPGFNNTVFVQFRNILSASAIAQDIKFSYDSRQTFVGATPAPASVDTINRIVTWNTPGLNIGSLWTAQATFRTTSVQSLGAMLVYRAWVDVSSCSNLEAIETYEEVTVVGSYDPNDKAASPVGIEPGGRILPGIKLSYTIRFQNTGTYLAENVNIVDTISPLLNLATLNVQAASHGYEVLIRGREVTFRFSQINLPDSNANEPMSHGYIKYSIEPNAGFVQNTVIQNRADIYFDFNSPIRTNTTTNTADNFLGFERVTSGDVSFQVYPNPISEGNWQLAISSEAIGSDAKIYDTQGRMIYSLHLTTSKTEIDASRFAKGVYIIRVGNSASRIMKL